MRRDTGEGYEEFLTPSAVESGIETPTREELAKIDKKRKNKASNDDWGHPDGPDAKITKMKDSRPHLAHKTEHAVDLATGAVMAVTLQAADEGDTTTIEETLIEAAEHLEQAAEADETVEELSEAVTDKGYHSNAVLTDLAELEVRSYISEPQRGRRKWSGRERERQAVYAIGGSSRAHPGRTRQGSAPLAGGESRAQFRALLRNGRAAADALTGTRKHTQTPVDSRRRVQLVAGAAQQAGQRYAARLALANTALAGVLSSVSGALGRLCEALAAPYRRLGAGLRLPLVAS